MRGNFNIIVICFLALALHGCFSTRSNFLSSSDKTIHYTGRFDISDVEFVRFDWPNSTIHFQFTGQKLKLGLKGGDRNYFNVFIDDTLHAVLHQPKDSIIEIKGIRGKGVHDFRIQKRTEGEMGMSVFSGVYLSENEKLIAFEKERQKKIEFIGNSITCGYGSEGASRDENFKPSTENVDQSYALIVSRALNAEAHIIAHSGLGVVRNYGDKDSVSVNLATMPQRYDRVLDMDTKLKWDFRLWQPDLVVINLGTNDFSTQPHPNKKVFQSAYKSLIDSVNLNYNSPEIFLISGPLIDEPAFLYIQELTNQLVKMGDGYNLHFIGIPKSLLNSTTDLGSDAHPSYLGQKKIANFILPIIAGVMKWNYDTKHLEDLK